MKHIIMSVKEVEKVKVVRDILAGRRMQKDEAERLGVTTRCIRNWMSSFDTDGPEGLVHGNRGKISPRRVPKKEQNKIVSLIRSKYPDFGPTFACEKLSEEHQISRDPKTIRSIMMKEKLWIPGTNTKLTAVHRAWRERRAKLGELVQFDGSYHHWFEDREGTGEECLLAAIDDATGEILYACFATDEGTLPVMGFWTIYANKHGLPVCVYVDRFSTYKMTQEMAKQNPDVKTQLERAFATLGVTLVFALSPQAKGRVERLFKTLQNRLVKELRLRNISTLKEANRFLEKTFIPAYNRKFRVDPREQGNAHRPFSSRELQLLPETLCRLESRVVQNDFTCSFKTQWFQMLPSKGLAIRPQDPVVVREYPDRTLSFTIRSKRVQTKSIPKRISTAASRRTKTTTLIPT